MLSYSISIKITVKNEETLHNKLKLIILLLILVRDVSTIINPHGPTVVSDITNCVSEIIAFNFKKPGLLIFANTNNVSTSVARIRIELLKKLNKWAKYSIEVKIPRNDTAICDLNNAEDNELNVLHKDVFEAIPAADYFVVVIDSYKDFTYVASRIIRSRNWNPHAKFIILFFHIGVTDKVNIAYVENMMSCLFKHNVINIVVIVPQTSDIRNAKVYGWRPYDPPNFCGYFNETARNRLLVENTCERGVVTQEKDVFQDRLPSKMNGCDLYILALERQPFVSRNLRDGNMERLFINEMAKHLKFNTRYQIINSFRGEKNEGVWDGALKELVAKKGHILVGGIFPDFDVHEDFECSITYLADSYTWVVPRAFQSPPWIALIIIFKHLVWYCVIAGFFICALSWKILGHLSGDTLYNRTLRHCLLNTWISLTGFVAYSRPVTESLRVFFVFFNLYCILLITAYQTKLIDVLKNPSFEEQIDTIEELVKSDLKFGGFEELRDLFYNSSDAFDYFLGEQWIDVENITKALIDVAIYRNFSVLCSRLELAHLSAIIPELSDSNGDFKYYAFDRNMFTVPMEMIALRGFAFLKEFSKTLSIFKQAGVNEVVRRHFASLNVRRRAKLVLMLKKEQSDVNALSMQHLQGGFLILGIGFVGGSILLLIELLVDSKYVKSKISKFIKFVKNRK